MIDLYFALEVEIALDNYEHLVTFHFQICQPFNDNWRTNILLVYKQQGP